jgi:hypothetical protein
LSCEGSFSTADARIDHREVSYGASDQSFSTSTKPSPSWEGYFIPEKTFSQPDKGFSMEDNAYSAPDDPNSAVEKTRSRMDRPCSLLDKVAGGTQKGISPLIKPVSSRRGTARRPFHRSFSLKTKQHIQP